MRRVVACGHQERAGYVDAHTVHAHKVRGGTGDQGLEFSIEFGDRRMVRHIVVELQQCEQRPKKPDFDFLDFEEAQRLLEAAKQVGS